MQDSSAIPSSHLIQPISSVFLHSVRGKSHDGILSFLSGLSDPPRFRNLHELLCLDARGNVNDAIEYMNTLPLTSASFRTIKYSLIERMSRPVLRSSGGQTDHNNRPHLRDFFGICRVRLRRVLARCNCKCYSSTGIKSIPQMFRTSGRRQETSCVRNGGSMSTPGNLRLAPALTARSSGFQFMEGGPQGPP